MESDKHALVPRIKISLITSDDAQEISVSGGENENNKLESTKDQKKGHKSRKSIKTLNSVANDSALIDADKMFESLKSKWGMSKQDKLNLPSDTDDKGHNDDDEFAGIPVRRRSASFCVYSSSKDSRSNDTVSDVTDVNLNEIRNILLKKRAEKQRLDVDNINKLLTPGVNTLEQTRTSSMVDLSQISKDMQTSFNRHSRDSPIRTRRGSISLPVIDNKQTKSEHLQPSTARPHLQIKSKSFSIDTVSNNNASSNTLMVAWPAAPGHPFINRDRSPSPMGRHTSPARRLNYQINNNPFHEGNIKEVIRPRSNSYENSSNALQPENELSKNMLSLYSNKFKNKGCEQKERPIGRGKLEKPNALKFERPCTCKSHTCHH